MIPSGAGNLHSNPDFQSHTIQRWSHLKTWNQSLMILDIPNFNPMIEALWYSHPLSRYLIFNDGPRLYLQKRSYMSISSYVTGLGDKLSSLNQRCLTPLIKKFQKLGGPGTPLQSIEHTCLALSLLHAWAMLKTTPEFPSASISSRCSSNSEEYQPSNSSLSGQLDTSFCRG